MSRTEAAVSTDPESPAQASRHLSPSAIRLVRRGGWLLCASFGLFVAFVVVIIVFSVEEQRVQQEAADRLGVNINDVPARVVAPILREHHPPLVFDLALLVLILASTVLFALAVWTLTGVQGRRRHPVAVAATVLAAVATLAFPLLMVLGFFLEQDPPPDWAFDAWDNLWTQSVSAFGVVESIALICLILVLRPTSLARRTGRVVMVLSGLCVLSVLVGGSPPVVPLLLGAVLGGVLIRSVGSRA